MGETIKVNTPDLEVGDVIEGCASAGGANYCSWEQQTVMSKPVQENQGFWSFQTEELNGMMSSERRRRTDLIFTVRRSGPTTVTKVKDLSGRFPHVCPRCGGPAYVGLSTFECERGCR